MEASNEILDSVRRGAPPASVAEELTALPRESRAKTVSAALRDAYIAVPMLQALQKVTFTDEAWYRAALETWMKAKNGPVAEAALEFLLHHAPADVQSRSIPGLLGRKARRVMHALERNDLRAEASALDDVGVLSVGAAALAIQRSALRGHAGGVEVHTFEHVLVRNRDDEAAWWLATLAFLPDRDRSSRAPERYLPAVERALGTRGVGPMCALLERVDHPGPVPIYEWVAERDPDRARPVLLRGLSSRLAPVRRVCVEALARQGAAPSIAPVFDALENRSSSVRQCAAELLELWASPETEDGLRRAFDREPAAKTRAALERALSAVRAARLDSTAPAEDMLSSIAAGEPRVDVALLPSLRYCDGRTLSDHARHVLASRLSAEGEHRWDPLLWRTLGQLDPASAATWVPYFDSPWAQIALADAESLDSIARREFLGKPATTWVTILHALERRDGPVVNAWLAHLAYRGWSATARRHGLEALQRQAGERPLSALDEPPPEQTPGARSRWIERLEDRMISGVPTPWALPGLVYAFASQRWLRTDSSWLSIAGAPGAPSARSTRLVHPAELSESEVEAWQGAIECFRLRPPFQQLDRAVYRFDSAKAAREAIEARLPLDIPREQVGARLRSRGYVGGPVVDRSILHTDRAERRIGAFHSFVFFHQGRSLVPGVEQAMARAKRADVATLRVRRVEVWRGQGPERIPLDQLTPALASELWEDLEAICRV